MNNLSLKQSHKFTLFDQLNKKHFIIDSSNNVLYFISNQKIYSFTSESGKLIFLQDLVLEESEIICFNLLIEDNFLFLLFKNGKIITYDIFNNELFEHSIDTEFSIDCAIFSHDQEFLTLTTQNKHMLLLNKLMVMKSHYDMNKNEYGTNEMVNVNWGSKNTQFHGEGMRDKRIVKEEYYPLNIWDDSSCVITWRGDDNHFAINFVCSKGYRILKFFNREGILQHSSEYIPGLEKQVSWKPTGTVIAASTMLSNKHKIIFFEKNGLEHGNFVLPYKSHSFIIENLSWTCDSDILLVNGFNIKMLSENSNSFQKLSQNILFFSQSNYHWYIKQRLFFDSTNYIENLIWDDKEYSSLHLTSVNGSYYLYLYDRPINTTLDGKAFVIDSNQLNISDFGTTLIPPPMCNYSISFNESPVLQILQLCYSNNLLAIWITGDILSIFCTNSSSTFAEFGKLNLPISYNFCNVFKDFNFVYMPTFYKKISNISELLLPVLLENGSLYGIVDRSIARFDFNNSEEIHILCDINQSINTVSILSQNKLLLSNTNGQLYCFNIELNSCEEFLSSLGLKISYNEACSQIFVYTDPQNVPHIISLTCGNSLYFDQTLLIQSMVNSALLYQNKYLLFTTTDSMFYCWPLDNFDYTKLIKDYSPRSVEKGSKIITAYCAKVVVQLPRGNLEAFYPRILLLNQVECYIDKLDFINAFEILRKNRIDFNYVCDYNFNLFVQHCGLFLEQIGQRHVDWICLFLSELSNDNCYDQQTMANKVDTVCQLLFDKMVEMDKIKFLNPILLTFIKKQKSDVANALIEVKNLPNNKLRDEAIKFLLYVINANRLFNEALATYDFDILLMVASKSNKDPKEYISLVNNFKEIENEDYRKYKIDLYLQRFTSSLHHLSKCDDKFDEAIQLIESKHLYKDAIEIYQLNNSSNPNSKYNQIWIIYGNYLFKKKYYEEAAIVYKRASDYLLAFKMYVMSSNWNLATVCARKVSTNSEEFKKMTYSLSQQLILNGDYINGAYLLETYSNNYSEAFHTLVKGHEWNRAIRCFNDYNLDQNLIENELKSCLINSYSSITDLIDSNLTKFSEYLKRLTELKEMKQTINCNEFGFDADFDTYSDTSSIFDSSSVTSSDSNSSLQTLKTNQSRSRIKNNKRKEQRKYVLKRGSPNEDIQIVFAIKEIASNCLNLFSESGPLIKALYDIFYVNESNALQNKLTLLHDQLILINDFIWNSEFYERRLSGDELLRIAVNITNIPQWKIALN